MSKNAMAGAVTLCGVGLCMIGGAMMVQNGAQAHAAGAMPAASSAAAALTATAAAQAGGEPTVVWYGCFGGNNQQWIAGKIFRAWSDGTIEMKKILRSSDTNCATANDLPCVGSWIVISSPSTGYRAAADINADEKVDGADLTSLLVDWGDAPRVPFPPSDCPLNLINP